MDHMLLARASQQAYLLDPRLEGYVAHLIRKDQIEVVVFVGKSNLIVAFRGTDSGADWKTDFKFRKKILNGVPGKWHRGFLDASALVQLHIETRLGFSNRVKPIFITGHSLGGALAVLHAARLARIGEADRVVEVVTFGAPRVANWASKRWLDKQYQARITQYRITGDRVPTVPPRSFGYWHVGSPVEIGYDANLRWWDKVRIVTKGFLRTHLHQMGAYMEALHNFQR